MLMKNIIEGINQSSYYEKTNLLLYSPPSKVSSNPKMFLRTCKPKEKPSLHNSFNELDIADSTIENKNFPLRKPVTHIKLSTHKKSPKHQHMATQFNYALPPSLLNHTHHNSSVDHMKPFHFHRAKHSPVILNDDIRITIKYKPLKIIHKDLVDIGVGNDEDRFTLPIIPLTATHKKQSRNVLLNKISTVSKLTPIEAKGEYMKVINNASPVELEAQATPQTKVKTHIQNTLKEDQTHKKAIPVPILNSISPINLVAKTRNNKGADSINRRALTLRQKSFDNVELSPWSHEENV